MNHNDRVTHYAVVTTGWSGGDPFAGWYRDVNQAAYELLSRDYNYPPEAIYRLSEDGRRHGPSVGVANSENVVGVFAHLATIVQVQDHVFICIVGHGKPPGESPEATEHFHLLVGDEPRRPCAVFASQLGMLVNLLKSKHIIIAVHPCFSGGFVPALQGESRVVITSTSQDEENGVDWIGTLIRSLSRGGRDQGRSIQEAFQETVAFAQHQHQTAGRKLEHPQCWEASAGLAGRRYLGNAGRALAFSPAAIEWLRTKNARLHIKY